jgi:hypothetical protein
VLDWYCYQSTIKIQEYDEITKTAVIEPAAEPIAQSGKSKAIQ